MNALERLQEKQKGELDYLDYGVLLGVFSDKEHRIEAAEKLEKLRAELARLRKIEKAVTEWKESVAWYPDRECFCIHCCKLYFALEGSEE